MKMSKIVAFVFAACLMLPMGAQAAEYGVYVTPKIGLGIETFKTRLTNTGMENHVKGNKTVFGGGLAVGYDFQTNFELPIRAELEWTMWGSTEKKRNFSDDIGAYSIKSRLSSMNVLFANVYFDWHNETAFTPYLSAGLGMASVKNKVYLDFENDRVDGFGSKSHSNFAWNIGLGVSYAFNDMFSLDLGYRFAALGKGKTHTLKDDGDKYQARTSNIQMHQFMLGARVTF